MYVANDTAAQESALLRGMAVQADARFQSMQELEAALSGRDHSPELEDLMENRKMTPQ